ncbi:MAG: hybrid sensor histidine kinase/response regulator [Gammaproteobacteria bacterium]
MSIPSPSTDTALGSGLPNLQAAEGKASPSRVSNDAVRSIDASSASLGELAQAKIRFGINIAFILLGLIAYRHDPSIGLAWVWTTFSVCAVFATSLYLWARLLGTTLRHPAWRIGQRIASIVADNIAITWLIYFGGQALAGAYGVYLWITIGYGMRFGLLYLYGNLAASLVCYVFVTQMTPFWKNNPSLSIGLGIALLVVPLYAAFLIRRLHTAVADARRAYAAKSDFVAKMSHELRTPLHGIISVADLLGRTQATSQQKEMFRIISVSSNTLLDLINRILDISKFEDGTFAIQRERMNVYSVLNDSLAILWPQARAKGLSLQFFVDADIHPDVIGSPRQLQEVLINLCGNAVKFTETGLVRLRLEARSTDASHVGVRFEIVDTGPGLTHEQLKSVFSPFYQADNSVTRKHGGTGLGTAIARELVRLMGGEITVESEPGAGATFRIDLTFERATSVTESTTAAPIDVALVAGTALTRTISGCLDTMEATVLPIPLGNLHTGPQLLFPPGLVLVELTEEAQPAHRIRHQLIPGHDEILVPLCAIGPTHLKEKAVELGYSSFLDSPRASVMLPRIIDMAQALRRDYTTDVIVNQNPRQFRILVAEDNLTNQTIARMALNEGGFAFKIVANGEEALIALTEEDFDVALLDMHMPVMDGMEVARLYNFAVPDAAARVPLIMVTADSRPEVVADADFAGITRFLTKPLKPSAMIDAINQVIAEGEASDSVPTSRPQAGASQESEMIADLVDGGIVEELLGFMDPEDRETFFGEFVEDAFRYAESLTQTDSVLELDRIRNEMHALSGAARTVGARRLAAMARRIEYLPDQQIVDAAVQLQTDLTQLVEESARELQRMAGLD